jgi:hypothetical protein
MNKSKLILRSLLLMLVLWAVNAVVLKWPVHIDAKVGIDATKATFAQPVKGRQVLKMVPDLKLHMERGQARVRSLPSN